MEEKARPEKAAGCSVGGALSSAQLNNKESGKKVGLAFKGMEKLHNQASGPLPQKERLEKNSIDQKRPKKRRDRQDASIPFHLSDEQGHPVLRKGE